MASDDIQASIEAMDDILRQEEAIKQNMKPFKDRLKAVKKEKKKVLTVLSDHLKSKGAGVTLSGDGWEMCADVREIKTIAIQKLEGIVDQDVIQSILPDDEVTYPLRKKRRTK